MTPAEAIAALDRQIAQHGQPIFLRRGAGPQKALRAFVRGFKSEEIVGLVSQADRKVILSPTDLGAFGVPKAQDDVSIAAQIGKVQADIEPVHVNGVLVRVNLRVRMA